MTQHSSALISIVVTLYASNKDFMSCLEALLKSDYPSYEILVVDDASPFAVHKFLDTLPNLRVIRHALNRGVAAARNTGITEAKGEIVVMVDSDVLLERDSISKLVHQFKDPAVQVAQGIIKPPQKAEGLSQTLAAGIWHHSFDPKQKKTNILNSFFFAIRKEFINRIGLFKTHFLRPGGEEFELAARICARTPIYYDANNQVTHQFKDLGPYTRNLFSRMKYWIPLYFSKPRESRMFKQFSYRHFVQALNPVLAFLCISTFVLSLVAPELLGVSAVLFFVQFFLQRDLYGFLLKRYGAIFALKSVVLEFFWHLVIACGLINSVCYYIMTRGEVHKNVRTA